MLLGRVLPLAAPAPGRAEVVWLGRAVLVLLGRELIEGRLLTVGLLLTVGRLPVPGRTVAPLVVGRAVAPVLPLTAALLLLGLLF